MTQALQNQLNNYNNYSLTNLAFGTALLSGAGAVAAAIFTPIAPVGGAIFGGSYFLSSRLISFICDKANCCPDNPVAKVATFVLSLIGGIAAAAAITTAIGFPMTFAAGAVLTIATIGTAVGAILALGGCLCSSAIATGVALGVGDQEGFRV